MADVNSASEGCCFGFQQSSMTVTVSPGIKTNGLDMCGDRAAYLTDGLSEYLPGMPVKFDLANPGVVVPAIDGVDAIGISLCSVMANTDPVRGLIQRTGHIQWCYVYEAVGAAIEDQAAWWAIHTELAKSNIYVEFQ